jgi:hypothetical protein
MQPTLLMVAKTVSFSTIEIYTQEATIDSRGMVIMVVTTEEQQQLPPPPITTTTTTQTKLQRRRPSTPPFLAVQVYGRTANDGIRRQASFANPNVEDLWWAIIPIQCKLAIAYMVFGSR